MIKFGDIWSTLRTLRTLNLNPLMVYPKVLFPPNSNIFLRLSCRPTRQHHRCKSLYCMCSTDGTPPHLSQVLLVEGAISRMVAAASACERIKNTPMPFAIVVHMR